MTEKINKNDFIEIEFTGKADNNIFDTTDPKKAKEIGIENPGNIKSMIISVGNKMILEGLDNDLENKEIGKTYTVHLNPEKAFGKRNPQLIRTHGLSQFRKNNINPYPGLTLQLDNSLAKVLSVSGGRVTIDFNNPLAGKEVEYEYKITKKITDDKEKVNAFQDFFFRQRFEFELKDRKVAFKDEQIKPLLSMMAPKFQEITGLEIDVPEVTIKKDSKEKTIQEKDSKETPKKEN